MTRGHERSPSAATWPHGDLPLAHRDERAVAAASRDPRRSAHGGHRVATVRAVAPTAVASWSAAHDWRALHKRESACRIRNDPAGIRARLDNRLPVSELVKILEESRPALEAGIAEAEGELAELEQRRSELEALIARARAALGETAQPRPTSTAPDRLTLHGAMELVLDENGNRWMSVRDLADEINERALYQKRDRSLVEPGQIHARANKYATRFEKDGARVRRASR